ncbi:hypothetical protein CXG81DRAFT_19239 [Caulochytrium protostelioides]|uniref:SP-RING-type domain-containing protein n=1 Tax=Caulochytrium protostelioides TaxID=1555241 RepID=A0A4P9X7G2_9FUNG|nr:hypothetical protein CXG81DRAFT_19239 [Caulochytrium protostelioides]|eukprot:RKP00881.1 hypothetical protein CXG81DRAFT_19239 [Caulochytrium protostelioides]
MSDIDKVRALILNTGRLLQQNGTYEDSPGTPTGTSPLAAAPTTPSAATPTATPPPTSVVPSAAAAAPPPVPPLPTNGIPAYHASSGGHPPSAGYPTGASSRAASTAAAAASTAAAAAVVAAAANPLNDAAADMMSAERSQQLVDRFLSANAAIGMPSVSVAAASPAGIMTASSQAAPRVPVSTGGYMPAPPRLVYPHRPAPTQLPPATPGPLPPLPQHHYDPAAWDVFAATMKNTPLAHYDQDLIRFVYLKWFPVNAKDNRMRLYNMLMKLQAPDSMLYFSSILSELMMWCDNTRAYDPGVWQMLLPLLACLLGLSVCEGYDFAMVARLMVIVARYAPVIPARIHDTVAKWIQSFHRVSALRAQAFSALQPQAAHAAWAALAEVQRMAQFRSPGYLAQLRKAVDDAIVAILQEDADDLLRHRQAAVRQAPPAASPAATAASMASAPATLQRTLAFTPTPTTSRPTASSMAATPRAVSTTAAPSTAASASPAPPSTPAPAPAPASATSTVPSSGSTTPVASDLPPVPVATARRLPIPEPSSPCYRSLPTTEVFPPPPPYLDPNHQRYPRFIDYVSGPFEVERKATSVQLDFHVSAEAINFIRQADDSQRMVDAQPASSRLSAAEREQRTRTIFHVRLIAWRKSQQKERRCFWSSDVRGVYLNGTKLGISRKREYAQNNSITSEGTHYPLVLNRALCANENRLVLPFILDPRSEVPHIRPVTKDQLVLAVELIALVPTRDVLDLIVPSNKLTTASTEQLLRIEFGQVRPPRAAPSVHDHVASARHPATASKPPSAAGAATRQDAADGDHDAHGAAKGTMPRTGAGAADDDEMQIVVEYVKIPLRCPVTMLRMKKPVRGNLCKHLACFDLESWVTIHKNAVDFRCMLCPNRLFVDQLVWDRYIERLCQTVAPGIDEVYVMQDMSVRTHLETSGGAGGRSSTPSAAATGHPPTAAAAAAPAHDAPSAAGSAAAAMPSSSRDVGAPSSGADTPMADGTSPSPGGAMLKQATTADLAHGPRVDSGSGAPSGPPSPECIILDDD